MTSPRWWVERLAPICAEAGAALTSIYESHADTPITVHRKTDETPVTRADHTAHTILAAALERLDPSIPVLSEEGEIPAFERRRHWQRLWLVDPLDGTREFIDRSGDFCISIALVESSTPVLGVIYRPLDGTLYWGAPGHGAAVIDTEGEHSLTPRPLSRAEELVTLTSRRGSRSDAVRHVVDGLRQTFPAVRRHILGSALKFCDLATGAGHLYPRFGPTSEWDTAAGQALLEAVGGGVVDLHGRPLACNTRQTLQNPSFLAYGPAEFDWFPLLQPLLQDRLINMTFR